MPSPVPLFGPTGELSRLIVARPVSQTHGQRWALALANLAGRLVQPIGSFAPHDLAAGTTAYDIPVQYHRSIGARCVLIRVCFGADRIVSALGVELPSGDRSIVTITAPAGAGAVHGGGLDGATEIPAQSAQLAARADRTAIYDVSGVSTSAPLDWVLNINEGTGSQHQGLRQIHVIEVPLDRLEPSATEPGLEYSWPDPRNFLEDGSSSTARGFARWAAEEKRAALEIRQHWQIGTYRDTGVSWKATGTALGAIDWVGTCGTTDDPIFYARARRLYAAATGNRRRFRVHYLAVDGGQVRMTATAPGGSTVNTDLTLPASAVWATAEITASNAWPTDGTGQEVALTFSAKTNNAANPTYLASLAAIENET